MCVDGPTRGTKGSKYGDGACNDAGRKAVVVQVTDSCPCHYPNNHVSNAKWCWCAALRCVLTRAEPPAIDAMRATSRLRACI
jgi:ferredoxin-thioredoxin reductase catalytic subunit